VYEVLPQISATRDSDKPNVEDVVKHAAEENPQKLRQIGLHCKFLSPTLALGY
jgi:hypothetical protein